MSNINEVIANEIENLTRRFAFLGIGSPARTYRNITKQLLERCDLTTAKMVCEKALSWEDGPRTRYPCAFKKILKQLEIIERREDAKAARKAAKGERK